MSSKKVRYAVVALGDISQEALLPGVKHTGNSEVTAFVSGDLEKARVLAKKYDVEHVYEYAQFDSAIRSGAFDAMYLATPNWRHAEFAIPALNAGIHVLSEKPLEVSVAKCREIVEAQRHSSAKLMVAYRLHFEPSTLKLIERIRSGELGTVHLFTATFSQMVSPGNHRAKNGEFAGPLFDMGPYPVNAARYVFGAEPTAVVSAFGTRHSGSQLGNFADTVAVTLEFPENRIAQFTVSYYANSTDTYTVAGTKGAITVTPGFSYKEALEQQIAIEDRKSKESFKHTDQFGGEMEYFSDCILNGKDPEPDAEEGLADVRVLEGILEALNTRGRVELPPFTRSRRIDPAEQKRNLSAVSAPKAVGASSPGKK